MSSKKIKVLFVGLSNKPNIEPFDTKTNSGKVVDMIVKSLDCECYKINIVNYAPLDGNNRLRYPTKTEIQDSVPDFMNYTNKLSPNLIVSFGNIVSSTLKKIDCVKNITLYKKHPSYMYIYKRKHLDKYVEDIVIEINKYKAQM